MLGAQGSKPFGAKARTVEEEVSEGGLCRLERKEKRV